MSDKLVRVILIILFSAILFLVLALAFLFLRLPDMVEGMFDFGGIVPSMYRCIT